MTREERVQKYRQMIAGLDVFVYLCGYFYLKSKSLY